ncbi:ATPase type 13A (ISS) [Dorcoceras hygrometricum]|uniref:ATPase type 13A (ISS) n=1 Tax=Dorcoceras hygrometricum TaxID=472368 RepID=A0A2Z7C272_9LAMI|nr:ATPase type 13A (ISS) [Dorcoceras hygrometricum]
MKGGGVDRFRDDLEFDARMEHEGQKDQEITADEREGSHYDSIPTVPVEGEGDFDDEHLATGSKEPEKADHEQDAQMLVVPTSADPSTIQLLDTTSQTLTDFSTRVSSLDLTFARIRDDTHLTKHHTTLLRDQLKHAVDGLDVKIDVLEHTLTQKMDENIRHFATLETTMVRNYADSHQQRVDEMALVKSQLAAMVESLKEFGADKKGGRRIRNQLRILNQLDDKTLQGPAQCSETITGKPAWHRTMKTS